MRIIKKQYFKIIVVLLLFLISALVIKNLSNDKITMYQLPNQTQSQMMSYVIETEVGLFVIDGGTEGDSDYLYDFIINKKKPVMAWFLTHPHYDHTDALAKILNTKDTNNLIQTIYYKFPSRNWIETYEPLYLSNYDTITDAMKKKARSSSLKLVEMNLNDEYVYDGIRFKCLYVPNEQIIVNAINNSSVVLEAVTSHKKALFLGDLGSESGDLLLKSLDEYDVVQMSHHGQAGVGLNVYKAINPKECFWPTPDWLFYNDSGKGKNSGPWETKEVWSWLQHLNVQKHYIMKDGLTSTRLK